MASSFWHGAFALGRVHHLAFHQSGNPVCHGLLARLAEMDAHLKGGRTDTPCKLRRRIWGGVGLGLGVFVF